MSEFLVGLLLAIVVGLLFYRRRRAQKRTEASGRELPEARPESRFHAVSIRFAADACNGAKGLAGTRFLAAEAPELPLSTCDASSCQCRFVHHQDRRSGKDRRSPFAAGGVPGSTGKFSAERRAGGDRRYHADRNDLDFTI